MIAKSITFAAAAALIGMIFTLVLGASTSWMSRMALLPLAPAQAEEAPGAGMVDPIGISPIHLPLPGRQDKDGPPAALLSQS